ncbi:putative RNA-directed DNA polymerase from transposon BS [Orchesella cincta]|uniref:Putative RNA-directed DNA polymerase from transposon BS n=1 Tax=Orchesella cincta TaxID=48709 RepID=A0A1D2M452_ORCCI|nr:putative RNA-directed DNA polymerase from transposon BS [Orchesella cincta]
MKSEGKQIRLSNSTNALLKANLKAYKLNMRKPSLRTSAKLYVLKRRIKTCIKADTKYHLNSLIHEHGTWKGLKKLFTLKQKKQLDGNLSPDDINDFYVNISKKTSTSTSLPDKPPNLPSFPGKFTLLHFTQKDLFNAWSQMKNTNSKSSDPIGICPLMIKLALQSESFCCYLISMFNLFIDKGKIPEILKTSRVVPVPKIDDPKSPNDTRPIGIQPVLTKLLEKCILHQLSSYIESSKILSDSQFGFRKKLSTTHALIAITDFIYTNFDQGHICIMVSLDFQKAFDKVNRRILLHKMKWYGINCPILESLLKNRKQFVSCNYNNQYCKSNTKETELGVVQGSSISALFFSLMINDLPLSLKNTITYMFADDSNILIAGKPSEINEVIALLEADLSRLFSWLSANEIQLNIDKTKVLFLGKPHDLKKCSEYNVHLNGIAITRVESVGILGVIFDQNLSWFLQTKQIIKKSYGALSYLYPFRYTTSQETRLTLVNAYVLPIINYACIIWLSRSQEKAFKVIDRILRSCARFILGRKKYDSVTSSMCNELGWLSCKNMFSLQVLCFTYRIMFNNYKGFFKNYLDFSFDVSQNTRTQSYLLPKNKPKSYWGECAFKYKSVALWLKLPESVCNKIKSLNIFKSSVHSLLLKKQCDEISARRDEDDNDIINDCINYVISIN